MELDKETDGAPNTSTLIITDEILKLIAEIDEFKGAWKAIGRIAPERLSSLRHVATIESIGCQSARKRNPRSACNFDPLDEARAGGCLSVPEP